MATAKRVTQTATPVTDAAPKADPLAFLHDYPVPEMIVPQGPTSKDRKPRLTVEDIPQAIRNMGEQSYAANLAIKAKNDENGGNIPQTAGYPVTFPDADTEHAFREHFAAYAKVREGGPVSTLIIAAKNGKGEKIPLSYIVGFRPIITRPRKDKNTGAGNTETPAQS